MRRATRVAFIFMFIVAGTTALSAWLMKDVVNLIFVDREARALIWLPIVVVSLFTAKGLASYFQDVTLARIGNRMVAETQTEMFDHLLQAGFRLLPAQSLERSDHAHHPERASHARRRQSSGDQPRPRSLHAGQPRSASWSCSSR